MAGRNLRRHLIDEDDLFGQFDFPRPGTGAADNESLAFLRGMSRLYGSIPGATFIDRHWANIANILLSR